MTICISGRAIPARSPCGKPSMSCSTGMRKTKRRPRFGNMWKRQKALAQVTQCQRDVACGAFRASLGPSSSASSQHGKMRARSISARNIPLRGSAWQSDSWIAAALLALALAYLLNHHFYPLPRLAKRFQPASNQAVVRYPDWAMLTPLFRCMAKHVNWGASRNWLRHTRASQNQQRQHCWNTEIAAAQRSVIDIRLRTTRTRLVPGRPSWRLVGQTIAQRWRMKSNQPPNALSM